MHDNVSKSLDANARADHQSATAVPAERLQDREFDLHCLILHVCSLMAWAPRLQGVAHLPPDLSWQSRLEREAPLPGCVLGVAQRSICALQIKLGL